MSELSKSEISQDVCRRTFLKQSAALAGTNILMGATLWAEEKQAASKTWRVGVIGHTGQGGYGHGLDTLWLKLPQTKVVAVADADPQGLQTAGSRLKGAATYPDYRDMLKKEAPELVSIGPRWIGEHREMMLAAIQAGAKGIYVEKPFCRSPEEADEIVDACAKTGCRLAIAHRNRYHPALPMVREIIQSGEIGTILELRGRGKEDHRGGGLDLWVLGSHVIDLARYFAGNGLGCSATLLQGGRQATPTDVVEGAEAVGRIAGDRLHARFEMENGLPFYFDSIRNTGVAAANFGLQIIGNRGIIDLRVDMNPIAHLIPGSPFQPTNVARPWIPITSAGIGKADPGDDAGGRVSGHLAAVEDLLEAIQQGRRPLCDELEGRAITEMICAVFASHVQGGQRLTLPLKDRGAPLENWR